MITLLSCELDKFCGVSLNYSIPNESGAAEYKCKMFAPLHPDFRTLFEDAMKVRVLPLLGFPDDMEDSIAPIGASYPSEGQVSYSVRVKGPAGEYKIRLPKVAMSEDDDNLYKVLTVEAEAYLNGKSAELSIFGEEYTPEDLLAEEEVLAESE